MLKLKGFQKELEATFSWEYMSFVSIIYITIAYRGARGDADDLESKKQKNGGNHCCR